ncbi:MAG: 16S rRNA methyltransferase [Oscillochloridaceae bacterium umkhey_bin13]
MDDQALDRLVDDILRTPKYRQISPALVRSLATHELSIRRTPREALKATKARLHQVAGAFLDREPRYARWLAALTAANPDPLACRAVCLAAMEGHASTRERLPILEPFYQTIFAHLPPVGRLLDLACGLNPLAAPWMQFPRRATYLACDLYADLVAFLAAALPLLGLEAQTMVCDLAPGPPAWEADVALVLKTLPVLEHVRRGAGQDLLRQIRAPYLVVSFPTRSLGGRDVGMAATYGGQIEQLIAAEAWQATRLEFANELVFVIKR